MSVIHNYTFSDTKFVTQSLQMVSSIALLQPKNHIMRVIITKVILPGIFVLSVQALQSCNKEALQPKNTDQAKTSLATSEVPP